MPQMMPMLWFLMLIFIIMMLFFIMNFFYFSSLMKPVPLMTPKLSWSWMW